ERGQEREVHAERLVRHLVAAGDLAGEVLGGGLGQGGEDAQVLGVGYRGGELRVADVVHAPLDDRVLDAEKFGDPCLHDVSLSIPLIISWHRATDFPPSSGRHGTVTKGAYSRS